MSLLTFAQHLRDSTDEIVERWKQAVYREPAAVPSATRLSPAELTDHLSPLLERISWALEGAPVPEVEPEAREHGSQRRRAGYDIAEVLCEHALLRQTLLDALSDYAGGEPGLTDAERDAARSRLIEVIDDSGRAAAAQYHAEAIAERQALEEALEAADHRKDEFLAMVAHELRNPLGVTRNALQVLRMTRPDQPAWARAMDAAERQIKKQVRLVDDLLDITRITRGKIELRTMPLDLVQLARQATEDLREPLAQARLQLTLELPDHPVWVEADPVRLSQCLANLLTNALKFTDPGGEIGVQVFRRSGVQETGVRAFRRSGVQDRSDPTDPTGPSEPERPNVRTPERPNARTPERPNAFAALTVRDTGIGIAPEMLPHLFELFAQAQESRERSPDGLGLGLALVKGLIELHGGQVRAESAGPGQGAAFTLLLPLRPDPSRPE